ncbi:hypothetical protein NT98_5835 (plasmid) [Bacillus cereus]|nr:hypothetical protein NT98_5835 [Bacillus cereus]AJI08085.1 hypothetical protein AQ16_5550 [Bacillus cereus G9241]
MGCRSYKDTNSRLRLTGQGALSMELSVLLSIKNYSVSFKSNKVNNLYQVNLKGLRKQIKIYF